MMGRASLLNSWLTSVSASTPLGLRTSAMSAAYWSRTLASASGVGLPSRSSSSSSTSAHSSSSSPRAPAPASAASCDEGRRLRLVPPPVVVVSACLSSSSTQAVGVVSSSSSPSMSASATLRTMRPLSSGGRLARVASRRVGGGRAEVEATGPVAESIVWQSVAGARGVESAGRTEGGDDNSRGCGSNGARSGAKRGLAIRELQSVLSSVRLTLRVTG